MTPTEQDNDLQFCESCSCMTRGNPTCGTYGEWNDLKPDQMLSKLEREFPEQFKKFMEMSL